ncbi:polymerase [Mucilaginibacter sp. BJC16-A38]|uniref:polymerase n=1 Tax=Mucilaginibacter phenanthrenivorans TaxID=1234842 RepID=UPI002157ECC1|nr:polymerase [Mucilaginibacter phenanthrenivorans]MCR8560832.1 polymerase [Mucilaginibacter phenanthrenivorans]
MKKLFTLSIFLLCLQGAFAQMNFLPKFIRKMYFRPDSSREPGFVLLPALSSAPETGVEFGGAALYSFYTDPTDRGTRVSSLFGYSTLTTKGQTKLSLNANYWTPQNKFHFTVNTSYYNFPFNFYGVGNNTRKADADLVDERRYKYSFNGEKLIGDNIYIGFVSGFFKYFYKYDKNPHGILNTDPDVQDKRGGSNVYVGPSFTFDNRNNNTYTTRGMIINAYYNVIHGVFANNSYAGGFFNIEYSQFFQLAPKFVLGVDIQEQSLTGARSPFYLLPQMGSDELMRGYYGGRYRDRNYIAGQTELRYRIANRFGLAGFVGTGEVFHSTFTTAQLKPNYGGGFRYFFDVEKGLAVRLDYGVGQQPAGEKRESGFYIALGQSF